MSRRTAIVEDFEDDTDLPLPARPLPNTGTKGAILEEISSDTDDPELADFDYEEGVNTARPAPPRPAPTPGPANLQSRPPAAPSGTVTDITPYKTWTCIYPIYIDAKRAYGTGERRIARAKAVWWPLTKDMADASNRLGLATLHEVNKSHPRDWDNPGRIRVQWKRDGKLVNPHIKSKKQLLEMISFQIQRLKPEFIPKAPYNFTPPNNIPAPPPQSKSSSAKGKQPQSKPKSITAPAPSTKTGCRLPVPPEPQPALASRLSPYSPAIATGVLIETIKAGMNAQEAPGGAMGGPNMGQKGKRKVVRVRG